MLVLLLLLSLLLAAVSGAHKWPVTCFIMFAFVVVVAVVAVLQICCCLAPPFAAFINFNAAAMNNG